MSAQTAEHAYHDDYNRIPCKLIQKRTEDVNYLSFKVSANECNQFRKRECSEGVVIQAVLIIYRSSDQNVQRYKSFKFVQRHHKVP